MIRDLIVRAAAEEFDAEDELERLADQTPSTLTPHLPDLLAAGVLRPAKLYRTAGDAMQRAIALPAPGTPAVPSKTPAVPSKRVLRGPVGDCPSSSDLLIEPFRGGHG
jgi:hypothetical protein